MASKPKTFDSETVALASAPLLVISEMHKVKPGFGKDRRERGEVRHAKESNPKADPGRLLMALTQKGGITPTLH